MDTAPLQEPASRLRGIVAIAGVAGVLAGPRLGAIGLMAGWVFESTWDLDLCWLVVLSSASVVEVVAAGLILGWLRKGGEWGRTVRRWFGQRPLRGLALGLSLTLPVPLTLLFLHGSGALAVPDPKTIYWGVNSVTLSPIAQEVVFRGLLFGVLWKEARLNPWMALALSSLVFGGLHVPGGELLSLDGVLRTMYFGGAGALLCWAFWRRGEDLSFPIGFHVGLNLWILLMIPPSGANRGAFELAFGYSIIAALALAYVVLRVQEGKKSTGSWFWTRWRRNETSSPTSR